MDYLRWELERQRLALAALLLGGGDGGERAGPVPAAADAGGAGGAGAVRGRDAARTAGGGGRGSLPRLETVQAAETPPSAWEAILGGEAAPEERAWAGLGGGTGAQPELLRPSGGHAARQSVRRTGAEGPSAGSGGDRPGDGPVPSGAGPGREAAAGDAAAFGRPARFRKIRREAAYMADTPGLDGLSASRTGPWGGREAAALRAEDGARALSRAVQRDARRYDGGFNIF